MAANADKISTIEQSGATQSCLYNTRHSLSVLAPFPVDRVIHKDRRLEGAEAPLLYEIIENRDGGLPRLVVVSITEPNIDMVDEFSLERFSIMFYLRK